MIIIAIDGPAGSGKGTVAKYLAARYGLKHLDTGLLYRYLAFQIVENHISPTNEPEILNLCQLCDFSDLSCEKLKLETTASVASQIAIYPAVRSLINEHARQFVQNISPPYRGGVLDGRDVGTVIFPNASLKIFITASSSVRAERRRLEMEKNGTGILNAQQTIDGRDMRDTNRTTAPLLRADDAHILDTTNMNLEQAYKAASALMDVLFGAKAIS
jgi:cytidylate kinase